MWKFEFFFKFWFLLRLSDFLADCAERIQVLKLVHDRLINRLDKDKSKFNWMIWSNYYLKKKYLRFRKFLVYLGYSHSQAMEYKVKEFCKLISEFALEYKTVRDRLLQQQEKRANHRERHKTRGKMITDVSFPWIKTTLNSILIF